MSKSKAFTLAEVLITLVIIGVIAAMTIPTLMGNTNDMQEKAGFKKAVSAVMQSVKLDIALYGTKTGCANIDSREKLATILKNHMSVIEEWEDGNWWKTADGQCYGAYDCHVLEIPTDKTKCSPSWEDGTAHWIIVEENGKLEFPGDGAFGDAAGILYSD